MEKKKFSYPLVNAHAHSAMIAFRGLVEDVALHDWLEKHIWPMEKEKVNPDFVRENTKKAILEMKRNGIRAFADMYFFEDEVAQAACESGMHAVIGGGLIDFPTPDAKNFDEGLENTEKLLEK